MYVDLPPTHCSQCGSENNEIFSTREFKGIRCRKCGHEKITDLLPPVTAENVKEAYMASERREF